MHWRRSVRASLSSPHSDTGSPQGWVRVPGGIPELESRAPGERKTSKRALDAQDDGVISSRPGGFQETSSNHLTAAQPRPVRYGTVKSRVLSFSLAALIGVVWFVGGCGPTKSHTQSAPLATPPPATQAQLGPELSAETKRSFADQLAACGVDRKTIAFRGREISWSDEARGPCRTILNEHGMAVSIWTRGYEQRFKYNSDGSIAERELVHPDGKIEKQPAPGKIPLKSNRRSSPGTSLTPDHKGLFATELSRVKQPIFAWARSTCVGQQFRAWGRSPVDLSTLRWPI